MHAHSCIQYSLKCPVSTSLKSVLQAGGAVGGSYAVDQGPGLDQGVGLHCSD